MLYQKNEDTKVFEIVLNDMNYDEESENEMIQPADLRDLKPLAEDEDRYKPLHSHVKYYNQQNSKDTKQFSNVFPYLQPRMEEIFNSEEEDKPFIAGFKHELDEYFSKIAKETTTYKTSIRTRRDANLNRIRRDSEKGRNMRKITKLQNYRNDKSTKIIRVKREEAEYRYGTTLDEEMDFFQVIRDRNVTTSKTEIAGHTMETQMTRVQYDTMYEYGENVTIRYDETTYDVLRNQILTSEESSILADTESSDEEPYDYEKFKIEYEQQLEYNIKHGKVFNYTEKEEVKGAPQRALERIIDLKRPTNCTREELDQIGVKAIKCLIYDYQRTRDIPAVKKMLFRTWLVIRVWLLIYICLAIPCWCHRGWCCCCFRCKFCFPRKRILLAKQYYVLNPPGTFVKNLKKPEDVEKYEVTEYESNAYEAFEAAIRNI